MRYWRIAQKLHVNLMQTLWLGLPQIGVSSVLRARISILFRFVFEFVVCCCLFWFWFVLFAVLFSALSSVCEICREEENWRHCVSFNLISQVSARIKRAQTKK